MKLGFVNGGLSLCFGDLHRANDRGDCDYAFDYNKKPAPARGALSSIEFAQYTSCHYSSELDREVSMAEEGGIIARTILASELPE
jgi:hypothetical protein